MAYPEGNFANLRAKERARRGLPPEPVVQAPVPAAPVAPPTAATLATDPRVAALRQEYAATDAPPQVAQPVPPAPGFLDEMRGMYGPQQRQADPRYTARREQLISEALRSVDEDEQPGAPRARFSQPYTPEFVQERVNQLRDQQTLGTLFGLSGDKVLGDVGGKLMQADPTAFMQDAIRQKQVTDYQQWQADMASQPTRANKFDRLSKMIGLMDEGEALTQKAAQGDFQNVPAGIMKEMSARADLLHSVKKLNATFKDEYQQVLGKYQSVLARVPNWFTSQGLEQVLANAAVEDKDKQAIVDSAQWWSNMQMLYAMPTRHENFGSALTPTENEAFNQALLINQSTSPAEVRKKLKAIEDQSVDGTKYRLKSYIPRYGYEGLGSAFEGLLEGGDPAMGAQQPQQPAAGAWQDPDLGGIEVR